jgi:hypothetical protein
MPDIEEDVDVTILTMMIFELIRIEVVVQVDSTLIKPHLQFELHIFLLGLLFSVRMREVSIAIKIKRCRC